MFGGNKSRFKKWHSKMRDFSRSDLGCRGVVRLIVELFSFNLIVCFLSAPPLQAELVNCGFVEIADQLDLTGATDPVARFVTAATSETLTVRSAAGSNFRLGLSDRLNVGADYRSWSFRINSAARFSNGQAITAEDAVYSIDRCAQKEAALALKSSARSQSGSLEREEWIDIQIETAPEAFVQSAILPVWLSNCPIYHKASSQLFADHFGYGTNIVSSGPYYLKSFKNGRSFQLLRWRRDRRDALSSKELEIKGFDDVEAALLALRSGALDLLYLSAEQLAGPPSFSEVVEKAEKDSTLTVSPCVDDLVILRRGFAFNCQTGIDVSTLYYHQ